VSALRAVSFTGKIAGDSELRRLLSEWIVSRGRLGRLLDHLAERIVEGERLPEDRDKLVEAFRRLAFEHQNLLHLRESQIDGTRRTSSSFIGQSGPSRFCAKNCSVGCRS